MCGMRFVVMAVSVSHMAKYVSKYVVDPEPSCVGTQLYRGGEQCRHHGRRVSSVVEHSSANPKVPGSIPGPVSYRGHGL